MTAPLKLFVNLHNMGGEGKTTTTEITAAISELSGKKTTVLDFDAGGRGYFRRNGKGAAIKGDWQLQFLMEEDRTLTAGEWLDAQAPIDTLIIDAGANLLASTSPANAFLGHVISEVVRRDGEVTICAVTSPNKAGSGDLVEQIYTRFSAKFEVIVVRNDRDGSSNFGQSFSELGCPVVNVAHIPTGLQALRLRQRRPLAEFLAMPEPNFQHATAMYANIVRQVAMEQPFVAHFGNVAEKQLSVMSAHRPGNLHYVLRTLRDVSDANLVLNHNVHMAWTKFIKEQDTESSNFVEAARQLHTAEREWRARSK